MNEIFKLEKNSFPILLLEIPDLPEKLYYRGKLPDFENSKFLAVVGSRKYSDYGRNVCEKLISKLSGYDIVIVSGLALGIDGIAHASALKAGLKTIAVPGSGIADSAIYPATHFQLAQNILNAGGCLMSEFDPTQKAAPYMFPQRNRIMAGLSHATLIIEAEEKSGTLITGRLAMEYNRDVLTVPGNIFSENTKGPHRLIRDGATLIRNADDILEVLNLKKEDEAIEVEFADCSEEEIQILEILTEPISRDDIIEILDIPTSKLSSLITSLEIKGLVKESLGKLYRS
jgi:DNA processing protein